VINHGNAENLGVLHYRKHNIDFQDSSLEDKFRDPEFLKDFYFNEAKSPKMRIYNDEKILYKTKDLPETLSGLFTDQKQF